MEEGGWRMEEGEIVRIDEREKRRGRQSRTDTHGVPDGRRP